MFSCINWDGFEMNIYLFKIWSTRAISHLKYLPSLFCFKTIIKYDFNDVLYSLLQVKILAYHWLKPYKYDSNDGIWKIIFYHFFLHQRISVDQ